MKATGKTITLVLLVLLIGVNIAAAMPASDMENRTGDATLRLFEGNENIISENPVNAESEPSPMNSNPIEVKSAGPMVVKPNLESEVPYHTLEKSYPEKKPYSLETTF